MTNKQKMHESIAILKGLRRKLYTIPVHTIKNKKEGTKENRLHFACGVLLCQLDELLAKFGIRMEDI